MDREQILRSFNQMAIPPFLNPDEAMYNSSDKSAEGITSTILANIKELGLPSSIVELQFDFKENFQPPPDDAIHYEYSFQFKEIFADGTHSLRNGRIIPSNFAIADLRIVPGDSRNAVVFSKNTPHWYMNWKSDTVLFIFNCSSDVIVQIETAHRMKENRDKYTRKQLPAVQSTFQVQNVLHIDIPVKILHCWLNGKTEDKLKGVELLEYGRFLKYANETTGEEYAFPSELFDFFSTNKFTFLDDFKLAGFISESDYQTLSKRLDLDLQRLHNSTSGGIGRRKDIIISRKACSHLRIISKFADGFSPSYRKLAKILGLGSVGSAYEFVKKMKEMELLTVEKSNSGCLFRLTERGKSII